MSSSGGSIKTWIGSASAVVFAVGAIAVGVASGPGATNGGACTTFTNPSDCGFPDASNTGVPTGTSLTTYTGPNPVTTANTVIDGKILPCIEISAANVTIQNSKVNCLSGGVQGSFAVYVDDNGNTLSGTASLTIKDSEIDCGGDPPGGFNNSTAFGSVSITALRMNIHGCENGADINENVTVEDSYIHDLRQCGPIACGGDGSHTDGLQVPGTAPNNVDGGAINVLIQHNTIFSMDVGSPAPDWPGDGCPNTDPEICDWTTSAIISGVGPDQNYDIVDNLLAGGSYTLYCTHGAVPADSASSFINNHFSTRYGPNVGYSGASSGCADELHTTGNVIQETGAAYALEA